MKNLILMILVVVVLTGCEETVQLDLKQVPDRLVVEGLITDVAGKQFVRITKSAGFYQTGVTNRISTAQVTVHDNTGETMVFTHNPNNVADSIGYYFPSKGYVGVVDRAYTLTVVVDGQTYEASDTLVRVTTIDSLAYQPNRIRERDNPSDGKIMEVLMFAKEPQETVDNYLFKYYRNDSLIYNSNTDVYVVNDYGVGENIGGFPSPIYYAVGDTARVEIYSISRVAYVFYNDLATILNSDGGMFSPPPANPRSNISNGALGFFQVSAMHDRSVIVKSVSSH
jgi:hypothetical protein